ncbi:hypothetical protein WH5701_01935 [Synechococcus sp. WH 5701]|nr:hypothetical protein WH5701_01935 [Synechococcus sp. WH 5701]
MQSLNITTADAGPAPIKTTRNENSARRKHTAEIPIAYLIRSTLI